MSAAKRIRQQKAEWRQPNEIPVEPKWFRESVLEYVGAQEALNDITSSMLPKDPVHQPGDTFQAGAEKWLARHVGRVNAQVLIR
jgi:hypothetical protein